MTSTIFTKAYEFNPNCDNISLHKVNWGKGTSQWGSVGIRYFLHELNIQTPRLTTRFGYSEGNPQFSSKDYNCQFTLDDSTVKIKAFKTGLKLFEKTLIQLAWENRMDWNLFGNKTDGQDATLEDVAAKFSPIIKANGDYQPNIKFSFKTNYNRDTREKEIITTCRDNRNKEIDPSEETIPHFSQCTLQVKAKSIWISPDHRFGVKFVIEQIKVYPPEERPEQPTSIPVSTGECLLDSDSEDDE